MDKGVFIAHLSYLGAAIPLNLGISNGRRKSKVRCMFLYFRASLFLDIQLFHHSGDACLDGHNLLVSNLRDGVDKYTMPTLHRSQSYPHNVLVNVPLQISVAWQTGMVLVGGDTGFACIFDYHTSAFLDKLNHGIGEVHKFLVFDDTWLFQSWRSCCCCNCE